MTAHTTNADVFPASMAWVLDNPLMRATARGAIRRLGIKPGMSVVDVGCGPGRLTLPAAQAVGDEGHVVALDLQADMLAIVARRAAAAGCANVRTLEAAAGSGALPEASFDVALLCTVLGEIPSERRPDAVREIAEALRPGGRLVVTEGIFDPHRQCRDAVLALTAPAGLELAHEDRTLTTTQLVFRRPLGS
jgi:ubiquinone/menaquinone biosynthesis C-methylase UbiE